MNNKDFKEEKKIKELSFKTFKEEENVNKENDNCFIYCDKSDCMYDDIFFKQNETKDLNNINKHKSSIDSNLTDKNLHEFLNDDLIKALDNDLVEPKENDEESDSINANVYIKGNSQFSSNASSPEVNIKLPKNIKNIDMNLNIENDLNKINLNNINNLSVNIDNKDGNLNKDENIISNNIYVNKEDKIVNNLKDKIKILNDPLFAPIFIPKKINNNIQEIKQKLKNEHNKIEKKKEKKNNSLRNKFDDDVEPIIMLSMINKEEKTKLPLEIRVGDWICLYCNNLNFSFRIKCNRCGLLRKSSSYLLKQKYNSNKYQYMSYNNYNDGYYNMNQNNNNIDNNMY